jgi:hypothetical protein
VIRAPLQVREERPKIRRSINFDKTCDDRRDPLHVLIRENLNRPEDTGRIMLLRGVADEPMVTVHNKGEPIEETIREHPDAPDKWMRCPTSPLQQGLCENRKPLQGDASLVKVCGEAHLFIGLDGLDVCKAGVLASLVELMRNTGRFLGLIVILGAGICD